jgi:hypothetical protein
MRQLSLRSPKGADTEGAGGISKAPDRAAHPWTVLRKQDRLGTRAQITPRSIDQQTSRASSFSIGGRSGGWLNG